MPLASILLTPPTRYVTYVNERFGFSVERPTFLVPQRPSDNGDGRKFRTGRIVMRVYAGWNVDGSTVASMLKTAVKGVKPTLAVSKNGWYALSWKEKGVIHYEKTFVSHMKRTTVEFEYPAGEVKRMGAVVTHVVRSFAPG